MGIKNLWKYVIYTLKGIKMWRKSMNYTLKGVLYVGIEVGLVVLIGFSSCKHKDLLFDEIPDVLIEVRFDWQHDSTAIAEGMRLFFYPVDPNFYSAERDDQINKDENAAMIAQTDFEIYNQELKGEMRVIDIPGIVGGTVSLRPGVYRVITYNNDSETVRFGNSHDLYTHHATTPSCGLTDFLNGQQQPPAFAAPYYPCTRNDDNDEESLESAQSVSVTGEQCRMPMNKLWASVSELIYVSHTTRANTVITLYPKPVHCVYSCEVRNVDNIEYVSQVSGAVTGLSSAHHFEKDQLDEECITVPFAATANIKQKTIIGQFLTFGHHDANASPHRLLLHVRMADGSSYRFGTSSDRFDVTAQVDTASNPRRVNIVVDGVDIPLSFPEGFHPTPDDWEEVNTDVSV